MKFLKYTLITLVTLVLIGGAGYLYASSGMASKPGYAKLTTPGMFQADTKIALDLGPGGVKSARWVVERILNTTEVDLDTSQKVFLRVLQDLQGVQLRIYDVDNNRQVFEQAIDDSVATLERENWQTLIKVREDDERVVIMQAGEEDLITGLSLLVSTSDEAVFINLVGPLSPESIAMIADSMN